MPATRLHANVYGRLIRVEEVIRYHVVDGRILADVSLSGGIDAYDFDLADLWVS